MRRANCRRASRGRGRGLGDLRGPRQRAWRQALEGGVLGRHESGDHAQEAFQLVPLGQRLQTLGTTVEDRGEVGQANGIALGDLAQRVFAVRGGGIVGTGVQGLPTSWRNHLRWCFQAQPPLTEPRVMARSVPLTQIAA